MLLYCISHQLCSSVLLPRPCFTPPLFVLFPFFFSPFFFPTEILQGRRKFWPLFHQQPSDSDPDWPNDNPSSEWGRFRWLQLRQPLFPVTNVVWWSGSLYVLTPLQDAVVSFCCLYRRTLYFVVYHCFVVLHCLFLDLGGYHSAVAGRNWSFCWCGMIWSGLLASEPDLFWSLVAAPGKEVSKCLFWYAVSQINRCTIIYLNVQISSQWLYLSNLVGFGGVGRKGNYSVQTVKTGVFGGVFTD